MANVEDGHPLYVDKSGAIIKIVNNHYVASIGETQYPAEIGDVDESFFDPIRQVFVMAAAIQ